MLNFLLLMILPILIALITLFVFKGKVLIWEFFAQIGVVALVVGGGLLCAYESRTSDTEVWNGVRSLPDWLVYTETSWRID